MIAKKDLLRFLEENMDKEEKGIPLYTMHLSNAMFLSSVKREDQEKVQQVLARLKADSQRHKSIYDSLIAKIEKEKKDVY